MKKLAYLLCCLGSLIITAYMGYVVWEQLTVQTFAFRQLMQILATVGWCVITYNIILRKYNWVQKLCK